MPAKPCTGEFSSEIQESLVSDMSNALRRDHPCELCGLVVSARLEKGRWVPEEHWASVTYTKKPTPPPQVKRSKSRYS